jgi:glycosidase
MDALLSSLYGDDARALREGLQRCIERWRGPIAARGLNAARAFDARDAVLIAYPDHLQARGEAPLSTLGKFCAQHLCGALSAVHVLPFHPSTSYEGYAITDYRAVAPELGGAEDLEALQRSGFELMVDLVLNHCSSSHPWFARFKAGDPDRANWFVTVDDPAAAWLQQIPRARDLPLTHRVDTPNGPRHVWTTYSPDLVDLNLREPRVLLELCDLMLEYAALGARVIRLDAFVYVWKQAGTRCLDLPQGHALVRLFQAVLDAAGAKATRLLPSITNRTPAEAFAYLEGAAGREADLVYNLPLSSLILHALYTGDARVLGRWLSQLPSPPAGRAWLNLTACHDGVGLSWLEGLVPPEEIQTLVAKAKARGALLSTRRATASGPVKPWELNATWFSACAPLPEDGDARHVDRFLATQAAMLSVRGVPALYLGALLAGRNDTARVAAQQDNRAINRGRFSRADWEAAFSTPGSVEREVLERLTALCRVRAGCAAFHPEGAQRVLDGLPEGVLGLVRTAPDGDTRVLSLTHFGRAPVELDVAALGARAGLKTSGLRELICDQPLGQQQRLAPSSAQWWCSDA